MVPASLGSSEPLPSDDDEEEDEEDSSRSSYLVARIKLVAWLQALQHSLHPLQQVWEQGG